MCLPREVQLARNKTNSSFAADRDRNHNLVHILSPPPLMCYQRFTSLTTTNCFKSLLTLIDTSTTLQELRQIHAKSITSGLSYGHFILTKLIKSFLSNNYLDYAHRLFDRTQGVDILIWNSLIRAYSCSETPIVAISLYNKLMVSRDVNVDNYTFPFVFRACAGVSAIEKGREVHGLITRIGYDLDRFVRNSLLSFYTTCGEIESARWVFDEFTERDVVLWNAMIMGYARVGRVSGVIEVFKEMLELKETSPNEGTVLGLLTGCLVMKDIELGREIHGYLMKRMDYTVGVKVGAVLVDFYAKCGCLNDARCVFQEMEERNTVAWNSLICGYSQNACPLQAIDLFREMYVSDVKPDKFTISGVLSACSQTGALNLGKWIQQFAERNNIYDVFVGTALVDMYAKCGLVEIAREVFNNMPTKTLATWNVMLSGYASHGKARCTLGLFNEMEKSRARPDSITFIAVLSACAHAGLVEEGRRYFYTMMENYKIEPKVEHYGCMVDLLGRAGLLKEAKELIERMEVEPNVIVWGALLNACSVKGNVEIGEWVANRVFQLDPMDGGSYVLLSNMYAAAKRFDGVRKVREIMAQRSVNKPPGCSMIEVGDILHEFVVADKSHPKSVEIYSMLDELCQKLKMEGYIPNLMLDQES